MNTLVLSKPKTEKIPYFVVAEVKEISNLSFGSTSFAHQIWSILLPNPRPILHRLDEANRWTVLFTGIRFKSELWLDHSGKLRDIFGSCSSIVWACALWNRSSNGSVTLAWFIVPSMPTSSAVPPLKTCHRSKAALITPLCSDAADCAFNRWRRVM